MRLICISINAGSNLAAGNITASFLPTHRAHGVIFRRSIAALIGRGLRRSSPFIGRGLRQSSPSIGRGLRRSSPFIGRRLWRGPSTFPRRGRRHRLHTASVGARRIGVDRRNPIRKSTEKPLKRDLRQLDREALTT